MLKTLKLVPYLLIVFKKFKKFNIFVNLEYELHNRILILEKSDDFFLHFFFETFWMIPNDKYT